jgi:hypothetical protein
LANKALKWVVQARGEKEQHVFETRTFNIGMLKWIVCRGGMLSIFYLITKRVHIILSAAFYCTGVCVCQEREMRGDNDLDKARELVSYSAQRAAKVNNSLCPLKPRRRRERRLRTPTSG